MAISSRISRHPAGMWPVRTRLSVCLFLGSIDFHHPLASLARDTEAQRKSQCEKNQEKRKRWVQIEKPVPLLSTQGEHREKRFCYSEDWLFSHWLFLCASVSLASEASGW